MRARRGARSDAARQAHASPRGTAGQTAASAPRSTVSTWPMRRAERSGTAPAATDRSSRAARSRASSLRAADAGPCRSAAPRFVHAASRAGRRGSPLVVFGVGHRLAPFGPAAEADVDLDERLAGGRTVPVEDVRSRVVALTDT